VIRSKARLLGRSRTLRREQIRLTSLFVAHDVRDELAGRSREGHAVPGEPGVHEHSAVEPADVRQRVVRKAHGARPAVRDGRLGTALAEEALELILDPWGRPLLFADLFVGRGVPPSADEETTVGALAPIPVTPVRVSGPLENAASDRRGCEHLAAYWTHTQRHEVLRVRVDADDNGARPDASALDADFALRHRDRARPVVDAGAGRDRRAGKGPHVAHRMELAVVLIDGGALLWHDEDAH